MNEEEKQAIERLKRVLKYLHENYKNTDDINIYKDIEIILNLIEKQQTKIKELEDDLYSANDTINEYKERMDKARRILEE